MRNFSAYRQDKSSTTSELPVIRQQHCNVASMQICKDLRRS